jgi:hypothetical protein
MDLARKLDERTRNRRTRRQLDDVLRDRHLADDLGLPHIVQEPREVHQW